MEFVEKRVTGDWIDIREKFSSPHRLKAHLKLDDLRLSPLAKNLAQSNIDGVVEVKRRMGNAVFSFISKLEHTTPNQSEILGIETEMRVFIYLCAVEHLYTSGILKPIKETSGPLTLPKTPIMDIFAEISARIADSPEFAKDVHVKNILMEIQMYQKEHAQFAALSPNIPDERAPQFIVNFKKRIDDIVESTNLHYQDILIKDDADLRSQVLKNEEDALVMENVDKLLGVQAQEISRIRSTMMAAIQDGYRFRDPLLRLLDKKERLFVLFDEELKNLDARQAGQGSHHELSIRMARNMALYLENNLKK